MCIRTRDILFSCLVYLIMVLFFSSCKKHAGSYAPFYSSTIPDWELDVYPDSVVTRTGDGGDLVTIHANELMPLSQKSDSTVSNRMPDFGCGYAILDSIYAYGASGLSEVSEDSLRYTPYAVYLAAAAFDPHGAERSLRALVCNGRIISPDGTKDWPLCGSSRLLWAIAAWQLYCVTFDKDWLEYAYEVIDRNIATDIIDTLDPDYSLLHGTDISDAELRNYSYPDWMGSSEIYQSMSLSVNVIAERAMDALARMAVELGRDPGQHNTMSRTLRDAINDHLWLPNLGYYSQYLYGGAFPVQSQAADSRGEALATALGTATYEQKRLIIARTPRSPYGLLHQFPLGPSSPFLLSGIVSESLWALGSADSQNMVSLRASIAAIIRMSALKSLCKNPDISVEESAGIVSLFVNAIAGIRFEADGLHFSPAVPQGFKTPLRLYGLRYGDSTLDISIHGNGCTVSQIELDGIPLADRIVPRHISGRHSLRITVENKIKHNLFMPADVSVMAPVWAPAVPKVKPSDVSGRIRISNYADSLSYAVYLNGQRMDDISTGSYPFYKAKGFTSLMLTPIVAYRWTGYSSRPFNYIPDGTEIRLHPEKTVRPVTFVRSIRNDCDSLVELTSQTNTRLVLQADVDVEGEYLVDVVYADSPLGGCAALRTLLVNGRRCGVIVMPRLGRNVSVGGFGVSNALRANLRQGPNTISIDYITPYNVNPDDSKNTVLVDYVRLLRL